MCKIYQYLRFSTGKQDEAVSGGVSYKDRNLITLFERLESGDTIVVSELSRLTRGGIIELSEMIEKFFKPRKVRLIIVNVGLDIDCAHTSPMVELQLAMLATFAKIEKQSIVERTKSLCGDVPRRERTRAAYNWRRNFCFYCGMENKRRFKN